ncbi:MAG TPA: tetratricopeptide repeat protein, partial [Anaerolineae bacterium]|nr:tetratricopeptide repeat protein [Anaerolineae bacterium]
LQRLANSYLQIGNYQLSERFAARWVALDAYSEDAMRNLLWSQLRLGRRNEVLQRYTAFAQLLSDELGIDPASTTQAVAERARHMTQLGAHNLPPARTPFVGRSAELERLLARLNQPEARLTTVLGMGGMGKTRLAHALGQRIIEQQRGLFLDGVWFVELVTVTSAESLLLAIANTFDLSSKKSVEKVLHAYLRERELLLILDNFEQLVADEKAVAVLADLLKAAPQIKLLLTSRERLYLYEEVVFDLAGMTEAVELFTTHAQRQRNTLWDATEMAQVAQICHLLQGVPLAIELAASWVRERSLAEIAASITQSFDFLATRYRNVPDRHRSVRAAFQSAWERLDASTQAHFAALSIFRGGFSAEAAQAVAAIPPDSLRQLTDLSLLAYQPESGRYTLHELLREFSAEQLTHPAPLRQQHGLYYLAELRTHELHHLKTGEDRLYPDIDNVRVAWQWAIEQQAIVQLKISVVSLARYWHAYSFLHEGVQLIDAALTIGQTDAIWVGRAKTEKGLLWRVIGENKKAVLDFEAALAILPEHAVADIARANMWLGMCYVWTSLPRKAQQTIDLAISLYKQLQDEARTAIALGQAYSIYASTDSRKDSGQLLEAALALKTFPRFRTEIVKFSGFQAIGQGQYQQAIVHFKQARELSEQLGDRASRASATVNIALAYGYLADLPRAEQYGAEALQYFRISGQRLGIASGQLAIAAAAFRIGDYQKALALYEDTHTIYIETNNIHMISYSQAYVVQCQAYLQIPQTRARLAEAAREVVTAGNEFIMASMLPLLADALALLG